MLDDVKNRTTIAQLSIWTKKFAPSLLRLQDTKIQKITASEAGELILSVFKPGDDKSTVVLSMTPGQSGLFTTKIKPQSLDKPNSFVQMARKYITGKRVLSCYLTVSPIAIVIDLNDRQEQEPNCLILDLDHKPPRIVLAKKSDHVPERYQKEFASTFSPGEFFFESFCEWSAENTKTKRRACFDSPVVGYCPFVSLQGTQANDISYELPQLKTGSNQKSQDTLSLLASETRRVIRNRVQFLERRLKRQKQDLPSGAQILFLQQQGEILKASVEKVPAGALDKIYKQVHKLKRRLDELTIRIAQGEAVLQGYQTILDKGPADLSVDDYQKALIKSLGLTAKDLKKKSTKGKQEAKRFPFYSFVSSEGEFIRVSRSAEDADVMVKMMPSHHMWFHVLLGEGSHVWLEKPKGAKKISPDSIRQAAILAVHYSKHSKAQQAEVQVATRADIEKKKNLPPGKILVRRCQTVMVKYDRSELQKIRNFE